MLREIVQTLLEVQDTNEGISRTSKRMKTDLVKALNSNGIQYKDEDKIQHQSMRINKNIAIGIASEFHDEYTVYDNGEEELNTSDIGELIDYLNNVLK